jgi:nicotinamide mononucleotide transporter
MQALELLGTVLGLTNLWLTLRQNIWCWPVGIACVLCFAFVFFDARLYSDLGLQVVYVVLQAYGWWAWSHAGKRGNTSTSPILRLSGMQLLQWCGGIVLVALGLGYGMASFTKADMPYLDAFPTAMSMAAQWLQANKVLQSWWLFVLANAIFIGVYLAKGLYITIALYLASSVLAVMGYRAWRASFAAQAKVPSR